MEFVNKKFSNESILSQIEDEEQVDLYEAWLKQIQNCVQCDKWGQVVEAVEAYQALERVFTIRVEQSSVVDGSMNTKQKDNTSKIALAIKLRIATIEKDFDGPMVDDMDMIADRFVAIIHGAVSFPLPLEEYDIEQKDLDKIARFESMTPLKDTIEVLHEVPSAQPIAPPHSPNPSATTTTPSAGASSPPLSATTKLKYASSQTPLDERVKNSSYVYIANAVVNGGALKPPREPSEDLSFFSVAIDRIGLKDVESFGYIDPYVVVTVADARACIIDQQQTPVARRQEGQYIYFEDITVHLEISIQQMLEGNCGIFFELMHYKSKKGKNSCRCWAFMEHDEIEDGPIALELYKKPADYQRKSVQLHSVKDLFLHVKGFVRTASK